MFNVEMLEFLLCPISNSTLHYNKEKKCAVSIDGQYEYPIVDDILVLMPTDLSKD